MAGPVSCGASAGCLATLAKILGLAAEWALINTSIFSSGKRQSHVLQLKHRFRPLAAHILDSVLIADVVGALDGVVHVPAPVIIRVITGNCAGDATLCRHSVRTCRKHFCNNSRVVSGLRQLQSCTHTCAASANNHCIKRNSTHTAHL